SMAECELVYRQASAVGAATAVEVGMAYGVGSLALADAIHGQLISIDPFQTTEWGGVAVEQLRRAGFADRCELIEQPSHLALPHLVNRGLRVDLALIDGWHTFDHCLVDFFYVDMLLKDGGVVIFDDVAWPAVNRVVRFVLANRAYTLAEWVPRRVAGQLYGLIRAGLRPRSFTIDRASAVALRKVKDDDRGWDHFAS